MYADWLDDRDDPLGGYIRADTELAALEPGTAAWEDAMRQLQQHCKAAESNFGGWEYSPDLERLREKIDQLRKLDTQIRVFGARSGGSYGHDYEQNPPLHEPDLLAFELRHGLMLPAEYRAFLLRICNGPVGPDYGLFPLMLDRDNPSLTKPFAVLPELRAEIVVAMARGGEVPQPDEDVWGHGYLELCEHGCGNESVLVVNGPLRGQIWWQGDLGLAPDPEVPSETLGFIKWYERWLDHWLKHGAIE